MRKAQTVLAVAALLLASSGAQAALTFTLGSVVNGTAPNSTAPWLTAEFEDIEGGVRLTLTSRLTDANEFISDVAFNVRDASHFIASISTDADNPIATWSVKSNEKDLPGGGVTTHGFDILMSWDTSEGVGRFNGTDIDTFTFIFSGLQASDFYEMNTSGLYIAAHVQGISLPNGGTTSGTITVPEPTTMMAGALLLLPFGVSTVNALRRRL